MEAIKLPKLLLAFAVVALIYEMLAPTPARARNGAKDPLVVYEQQKVRTERRKEKRREELDDQGAEMRDAKKSAEDSKQNAQQQEFGQPNQQSDRWTGN
ncbi:MAG TPA: hypothetical protein VGK30_16545 [Candidatus Binatia bacterium]